MFFFQVGFSLRVLVCYLLDFRASFFSFGFSLGFSLASGAPAGLISKQQLYFSLALGIGYCEGGSMSDPLPSTTVFQI